MAATKVISRDSGSKETAITAENMGTKVPTAGRRQETRKVTDQNTAAIGNKVKLQCQVR